eukprot:SAG22_NODE_496_length_9797_cov_4.177241_8_plen_220_part_00
MRCTVRVDFTKSSAAAPTYSVPVITCNGGHCAGFAVGFAPGGFDMEHAYFGNQQALAAPAASMVGCVVGQSVTALHPGDGRFHQAIIAGINASWTAVDWAGSAAASNSTASESREVRTADVRALNGQVCFPRQTSAPDNTVPIECVESAPNLNRSSATLTITYQVWMVAVAVLSFTDRAFLMRMVSTDYLTLLIFSYDINNNILSIWYSFLIFIIFNKI